MRAAEGHKAGSSRPARASWAWQAQFPARPEWDTHLSRAPGAGGGGEKLGTTHPTPHKTCKSTGLETIANAPPRPMFLRNQNNDFSCSTCVLFSPRRNLAFLFFPLKVSRKNFRRGLEGLREEGKRALQPTDAARLISPPLPLEKLSRSLFSPF